MCTGMSNTNRVAEVGTYCARQNEQRGKKPEFFGKPTIHYCNYPYGIHCIISWNRQQRIYKYRRLNNSKQRDNRNQKLLTSDFSPLPQTQAATAGSALTVTAMTAAEANSAIGSTQLNLSCSRELLAWMKSVSIKHTEWFSDFTFAAEVSV